MAVAISDLDIWRAANMVIRIHGTDAITESVRMIDAMIDRSDTAGCDVWRRIKLAIDELQVQPSGPTH